MLPCVNRFRVTLPAKAKLDAAAGDPASLELDGGEGSETILDRQDCMAASRNRRHSGRRFGWRLRSFCHAPRCNLPAAERQGRGSRHGFRCRRGALEPSISIYRWPPMFPANDAPLRNTLRTSPIWPALRRRSEVTGSCQSPHHLLARPTWRSFTAAKFWRYTCASVRRRRSSAFELAADRQVQAALRMHCATACLHCPAAQTIPVRMLFGNLPHSSDSGCRKRSLHCGRWTRCFSVADPLLPLLFAAEVTPRHGDRDSGVAKWIVERALVVDQGGSPLVRCSRRFNHIRGTKCEWG